MSQVLMALALSLPLAADEKPAEAKGEIEEANALTLATFQRMKCFIAGDKPIPLKRTKGSKLRWSNPVVGRVYGNVFLWSDDAGRPVAVISIFRAYAPWNSLDVECSSLSSKRLTLTCDDRPIWTPQPSPIEWKVLPSSPPAASNPKTRLVQMRALARRFGARVDDRRNNNDKEVKRELRPLTQPIYRYSSPDDGLIDGAMFCFAVGTDPEAILLLECRANDEGSEAWYYALARLNRDALEVQLDNKRVWRVEYIADELGDPENSYRTGVVPELK